MVVSDAVIRLLDGAIKEDSHMDDSFSHGLLGVSSVYSPTML